VRGRRDPYRACSCPPVAYSGRIRTRREYLIAWILILRQRGEGIWRRRDFGFLMLDARLRGAIAIKRSRTMKQTKCRLNLTIHSI